MASTFLKSKLWLWPFFQKRAMAPTGLYSFLLVWVGFCAGSCRTQNSKQMESTISRGSAQSGVLAPGVTRVNSCQVALEGEEAFTRKMQWFGPDQVFRKKRRFPRRHPEVQVSFKDQSNEQCIKVTIDKDDSGKSIYSETGFQEPLGSFLESYGVFSDNPGRKASASLKIISIGGEESSSLPGFALTYTKFADKFLEESTSFLGKIETKTGLRKKALKNWERFQQGFRQTEKWIGDSPESPEFFMVRLSNEDFDKSIPDVETYPDNRRLFEAYAVLSTKTKSLEGLLGSKKNKSLPYGTQFIVAFRKLFKDHSMKVYGKESDSGNFQLLLKHEIDKDRLVKTSWMPEIHAANFLLLSPQLSTVLSYTFFNFILGSLRDEEIEEKKYSLSDIFPAAFAFTLPTLEEYQQFVQDSFQQSADSNTVNSSRTVKIKEFLQDLKLMVPPPRGN